MFWVNVIIFKLALRDFCKKVTYNAKQYNKT